MRKTLQRIAQQQKDMGYEEFTKASLDHKMSYMRDIGFALGIELSEVFDNLPWKSWADFDKQPYNEKEAALELCDVFVFVFVLYITLNPSIDLEDAMEQTLTKIENRIKNGYGRKD